MYSTELPPSLMAFFLHSYCANKIVKLIGKTKLNSFDNNCQPLPNLLLSFNEKQVEL